MFREERTAVMTQWRFLLVLCTLILGCLLADQAEGANGKPTPEDYVRQQAAKGEVADLNLVGKKDKDRTLSARFLEDLLTGTYKVHWRGINITNAIIAEPLDLNEIEVSRSITFYNCRFKDDVNFRDAAFQKHLVINGSHFEKEADFHRVKVKLNLFCEGAIFEGPVNFGATDIGGLFNANKAKFLNKGEVAIFNDMKVGKATFFDQSEFWGPVDFGYAYVGGGFVARQAKFLNKEGVANFGGMMVGKATFFDQSEFWGPVYFVSAYIDGFFNAIGARFEGQGEVNKANFSSMKVVQNAFFDNAVFKGPVDFLAADIGGQFNAGGAHFESTEHGASFEGMRVGREAFFRNVTCHSEVNLTYGTFSDLYFQGAKEEKQDEGGSRAKLHLTGTQIQRELLVTNLELKSLEVGHLRVKGPATFEGLNIKEKADFQNASLETLKFEGITWPEQPENLKLDGLSYTSLCVDGPDNFHGALGLVKRSAFNPQNYVQLDDYCKRRGHQDWADTVSIAMKDRELDQRAWYVWWLKKIFWGWPAGYGRKPMRLLVASLIIILVGAALYNPKYLENDKNPLISSLPSDPEYSVEDQKPTQGGKLRVGLLRFLISLDQFLPAVNLGLADHWKAKDTHFLVWLFFTVEQGFGWIFVSIGLAALYTQIK